MARIRTRGPIQTWEERGPEAVGVAHGTQIMVMWRREVTQWDDLTGRTLMTCRTSCAGTVVGMGILWLVVGLLVAEWFSTHQRDAVLMCWLNSCRSALQLSKKLLMKWEIRTMPCYLLFTV